MNGVALKPNKTFYKELSMSDTDEENNHHCHSAFDVHKHCNRPECESGNNCQAHALLYHDVVSGPNHGNDEPKE